MRGRVHFNGYIDLDEIPDDRGSIDNWLARRIMAEATPAMQGESGLEVLRHLHISWDLKTEGDIE